MYIQDNGHRASKKWPGLDVDYLWELWRSFLCNGCQISMNLVTCNVKISISSEKKKISVTKTAKINIILISEEWFLRGVIVVMWFCLAARVDFVVELSVVECAARCKVQHVKQSLILLLFGYKHQAVKQSSEVIPIHHTISVLVHETESGQSILQTRAR